MTVKKKTPEEQKAALINQLTLAKKRVAEFDNTRADKIGNLAKRYRLIDLTDDILIAEFKAIQAKYKDQRDTMDSGVKKPEPSATE